MGRFVRGLLAVGAFAVTVGCGGDSFTSGNGSGGAGGTAGASGSGGSAGSAGTGVGGASGSGGAGAMGGSGAVSGSGGGSGSSGSSGSSGCTTSADCAPSSYCQPEGACGSEGSCLPRPGDCDDGLDPVCGCNGTIYDNAGNAKAAGAAVSADGEPCVRCPINVPSDGDSCPQPDLFCTWGSELTADCRISANCTNTGWKLNQPACSGGGSCPGSQPDHGDICVTEGAKCEYGATVCVCTSCGVGGPCVPPPKWACDPPPDPPCPSVLPNAGTACSERMSCGYGRCAVSPPVEAVCVAGIWQWNNMPCPQ